ncbi:hypothetical protein THAOC_25867 [Thalassiosira oceanica]|uniref:Uncharacterized protein n=1 Tax=Thalassiosira oceanica TaxID=159749 RepID=K0RMX8_THAOC|nr:hypothetical protein THAOC_25867 [Thalassiosira oceanica]|eukprot:EJK54500.1 hypothetical protein THAOC_25867 [Thalassiosira oceanica]
MVNAYNTAEINGRVAAPFLWDPVTSSIGYLNVGFPKLITMVGREMGTLSLLLCSRRTSAGRSRPHSRPNQPSSPLKTRSQQHPPSCSSSLYPPRRVKLEVPHLGVLAPQREKLLVRPPLGNPAVAKDDDLVGVLDGAETVGDDKDGPVAAEPVEGVLDRVLRHGAAITNHRLPSLGEAVHEGRELSVLDHPPDLLVRRFPPPVLDVRLERVVEQRARLRHDADGAPGGSSVSSTGHPRR